MLALYKKIKTLTGAVALEAYLSIILMFAVFYIAWMASAIIFNYSMLNSSTQIATQSGIAIMDREVYRHSIRRGADPISDGGRNNTAFLKNAKDNVQMVGNAIMVLNQKNFVPQPGKGTAPQFSSLNVKIVCGEFGEFNEAGWNDGLCDTPGADGAAIIATATITNNQQYVYNPAQQTYSGQGKHDFFDLQAKAISFSFAVKPEVDLDSE